MDANSCSGSERSFNIRCADRFLLDLSASMSLGSSEKELPPNLKQVQRGRVVPPIPEALKGH